jgi:hypothetical protein
MSPTSAIYMSKQSQQDAPHLILVLAISVNHFHVFMASSCLLARLALLLHQQADPK